jgi:uncharacterized protein YbaR (Trm112 family)
VPGLANRGRIVLGVTDNQRNVGRPRLANEVIQDTVALELEPWVVRLLACPVEQGAVRLEESELVCTQCGRRYPVQSGIPRMLPDQALGEQKF